MPIREIASRDQASITPLDLASACGGRSRIEMEPAPRTRLFNRDFLLLWQGQLVSQMGSQAFAVASAFWVKHETASASLVGLTMMLGTLPIVVFGPIGGVLADRIPRKRVIIACDAVAGVAVVSLAAVMTWGTPPAGVVVAWLCAASIAVGATRAFFAPALRAAVPSVAPPSRLSAANSLHEASTEVAALAGQAAGGVAFRVLGAPVLFLIDGASYLYAALSTRLATLPHEPAPPLRPTRGWVAGVRTDLVDAIGRVRSQPGLRALVVLAAGVNFFAAPVFVLLPFLVEDSLHAGPEAYGGLIAAFGAGGLAGYALAGRAGAHGARRMLGALAAMAACVGALGLARGVADAAAWCACAGGCNGFFAVGVLTTLQERTPDAVRGRVFGLLYPLAMGLAPVSMLLAGVVTDATGCSPRAVLVVCGVILIAVTGVAAWNSALHRYLGGPRGIS